MFIKSFFSSLRVRHHPQICQPENQLQKLHLREKQRHRQGRSHDRLTLLQHQHRRKKISQTSGLAHFTKTEFHFRLQMTQNLEEPWK